MQKVVITIIVKNILKLDINTLQWYNKSTSSTRQKGGALMSNTLTFLVLLIILIQELKKNSKQSNSSLVTARLLLFYAYFQYIYKKRRQLQLPSRLKLTYLLYNNTLYLHYNIKLLISQIFKIFYLIKKTKTRGKQS